MTESAELVDVQSKEILNSRGVSDPKRNYDEAVTQLANVIATEESRQHDTTDADFLQEMMDLLQTRRIVPGTPLLSAGRQQAAQSAAACTVVSGLGARLWETTSAALASGVGVGIDFSSADDPVALLVDLNEKILALDDSLRARNRRPVATMGTLRSDHSQVRDFINAKRSADFFRWRFNLSVRLVGQVDKWGHLIDDLAASAHYCAEPGFLYWDRFQRDNPLPRHEPLSTAPCAEVALAPGESCTFAYLNAAAFWRPQGLDLAGLEHAARIATRMLDTAVDLDGDNAYNTISRPNRRVGIGVMGFADLCILMSMRYGSDESIRLAREICATIAAATYEASTELAQSRGVFAEYSKSRYTDPEWTEQIFSRFIGDVDTERAARLAGRVERHGLRHSRLIAFPPTGNSSRIVGASQAMEPRRTRVAVDPTAYPALVAAATERPDIDVVDHQVTPEEHVRIQAAFQQSSLDAVSKTVNVHNGVSIPEVAELIRYADSLDCKGLTIFRDGCLDER